MLRECRSARTLLNIVDDLSYVVKVSLTHRLLGSSRSLRMLLSIDVIKQVVLLAKRRGGSDGGGGQGEVGPSRLYNIV